MLREKFGLSILRVKEYLLCGSNLPRELATQRDFIELRKQMILNNSLRKKFVT